MFKIMIPAVAALGLVAFAAKTQPIVETALPVQAAPAMGWHVSHEGQAAKLAYGVADSDQLAMMVTCAPGDDTAAVFGDVRPVSAKVALGDDTETTIPVGDVTLRTLANQGSLTVLGEGGSFQIVANPDERGAIGEFLDYCARKRA